MYFTKTNTAPADPRIIVNFAGLMVLRPGPDENTCTVGVHRWAPNHAFQVMLTVLKPQTLPTLIRLYSGYFDRPCTIRLAGDHASDFKAYEAAAGDLVRDDTNARNNPLDYRWALNMKKFYSSEALDINDGAKPLVTLKTGVLYTSNLTHRSLYPKFVKNKPFSTTVELGYFSARLGAAITPPVTTSLKIEWTEQGKPGGIDLPRPYDDGETKYIVTLINDPPSNYPAPHQEMRHYYNVLTVGGAVITDADFQWRMEYAPNQSTDRIPCMPILFEP